ncbi:6707_t:CDS:2 [Diversispora eburnea]|uniref:6707_t:CDS:1 n=1 Tax=Diversispora eburnea TaxID=1213867 RepID=A0A9N9F2S7_9GLOM|nr:6707_t:CDS:2 [Diversispora eburnea]
MVLASHELPLILRLCSEVNPKTVFSHARSLLSQPVILSLIHRLSLELNKYPDLKLRWMEEAVIKLNPKDHIIREHCERLLPLVKQRLDQYYHKIATQDPMSPNLRNISLLIHVVKKITCQIPKLMESQINLEKFSMIFSFAGFSQSNGYASIYSALTGRKDSLTHADFRKIY